MDSLKSCSDDNSYQLLQTSAAPMNVKSLQASMQKRHIFSEKKLNEINTQQQESQNIEPEIHDEMGNSSSFHKFSNMTQIERSIERLNESVSQGSEGETDKQ